MVDLHCHMLPEMDDGAHDLNEALNMARLAVEDGITDVILSPHMQDGLYHNQAEKVLKEVSRFQENLKQQDIPLRVHPGAEVHIHPMLIGNLYSCEILTICHAKKYILIELPSITIPTYVNKIIRELILEGIIPIIAHPERHSLIREDCLPLVEWIEQGALVQLNAGSLLGLMGKRIQQFAQYLMKNRMVHVLASDGHNTKTRKPILTDAYRLVSELGSNDEVELFQTNAQAILHGKPCIIPIHLYQRKHRKFWWLKKLIEGEN